MSLFPRCFIGCSSGAHRVLIGCSLQYHYTHTTIAFLFQLPHSHTLSKSVQRYEKFLTFANILRIFLRSNAFFFKIVYLSIANAHTLIQQIRREFQHSHLTQSLRVRSYTHVRSTHAILNNKIAIKRKSDYFCVMIT